MFECHHGRVTLIDIGTMLDDAVHALQSRAELLRTGSGFSDVTAPAGPFRLRYAALRNPTLVPSPRGERVAISWELEPLDPGRGETVDTALAPASEFRRVADHIDPHQAAVTMWVYPDSFPLFRRLRDYLYDHDIVVAGRPIPEGVAIRADPRGTASRGQ
jgi:hypothetical protein